MLFFLDCSTVIWGAPSHVSGTPRHVACAPNVLSDAPRCSQTYHNHSHVPPAPVIRDLSYSEGRPQCPPRGRYSPEIDSSKFTLHILLDTPGGFQWLKYILLMPQRVGWMRKNKSFWKLQLVSILRLLIGWGIIWLDRRNMRWSMWCGVTNTGSTWQQGRTILMGRLWAHEKLI